MVYRSIAVAIAIIAIAHAVLTPDGVVPENNILVDEPTEQGFVAPSKVQEPSPSTVSQSLTELNQGIHTERQMADAAKVSKLAHSVEMLTSGSTPKDGGTAALAQRVSAAKQAVKAAITAMSNGLTSDYNQGLTDLQTLKSSINEAVQDVSADEQGHLQSGAHQSCSTERAAEQARGHLTNTTNNRNNYDPTIPTNLAFFKELGSITQCNRDSATATCPDPTVAVSSTLMAQFKAVTQSYHDKDVAMRDAEAAKQAAEAAASGNLTALTSRVSTVITDLVNFCKSDGDVYNNAVNEFNTNNQHRGSMLHTLRQLECTMDHIDNSAGSAIAVNDPADPANTTATSEATCRAALKTKATLQNEKFAAITKQSFTCPSAATYVDTVKAVLNMQLTSSWEATQANCVPVLSANEKTCSWSTTLQNNYWCYVPDISTGCTHAQGESTECKGDPDFAVLDTHYDNGLKQNTNQTECEQICCDDPDCVGMLYTASDGGVCSGECCKFIKKIGATCGKPAAGSPWDRGANSYELIRKQ
jgi:hypothetical protein